MNLRAVQTTIDHHKDAVTDAEYKAVCDGLKKAYDGATHYEAWYREDRVSTETYWNERVWEPSPYSVISLFCKAWMMKFDTTRPSFGCMRLPKVLKILATLTSTPPCRW